MVLGLLAWRAGNYLQGCKNCRGLAGHKNVLCESRVAYTGPRKSKAAAEINWLARVMPWSRDWQRQVHSGEVRAS